jgi:hypothetical protein
MAAPGSRLYDIASAANFWVPLAHAPRARKWGLEPVRHGERLRVLCDAYGLDGESRLELLDVVARRNAMGYEIHRLWGGVERRPGWAEMWDGGSGEEILARTAWFDGNRSNLVRFLS